MKNNTKKFISALSLAALVLTYAPGALSQSSSEFITNVRVDALTETSAKVLWDTAEITNTAAVYYGIPGDLNQTSYDICSANGGVDVTHHCIELSGLSPGTEYYYTVEVLAGAGTLLQSDGHTFTALGADTTGTNGIPAAPGSLTAVISTTGTDIILNWQDNSENEDRFELYYTGPNQSNYALLDNIGAGITEYIHTALSAGSYQYKVRACNINNECSSFTATTATIETEGTAEETTSGTSTEGGDTTATENTGTGSLAGSASLSGTVTDHLGAPVAGVWIEIYTEGYAHSYDATTDTSGAYAISDIAPGTYVLKTYLPSASDRLAAEERTVTLDADQTRIVDLSLRSPQLSVHGTVYLDDLAVDNAFVWAWSESGGYYETETAGDGAFSIPSVSLEIWHIGAGKKVDGIAYKSPGTVVKVGTINYLIDIHLERIEDIGDEELHTADADQETTVKTEDEVEIVAPANSVSDSGSVTFTVAPDVKTPEQDPIRKVVGTAYDLNAKDSSGSTVTQFQSEVTVTLPYKEGDIASAGGTEDTVALYFWDESVAKWKKFDNSTVDRVNNKVSAKTTHFTRFAVLTVVQQVDLSGIADGDLIKTADNPDIYIAKFIGPKKYKRLILNPDIFNSYGHLKWENVKVVTQSQVDAFFLSELTMEVYADGTPVNGKVYTVSSPPGSDVGIARRLDITAAQFEKKGFDWDGIFKINHFEASPDFYPAGTPITA